MAIVHRRPVQVDPPAIGARVPHPEAFAPWRVPLSSTEYLLVYFGLLVAALALFAAHLRGWATRGEVGPRYRPAVVANLCLTAVATVSYALILAKFESGYRLVDGVYVPTSAARLGYAARYMDWTVTVPLLLVELIAVSTLTGRRANRTRTVLIVAAVAMTSTGFLGGAAIGDGRDPQALLAWGAVSTAFYLVIYCVLVWVVTRAKGLRGEAGHAFRAAVVLLLTVWLVYPLTYVVQIVAPGNGASVMTIQLAFSAADITAKVGFGVLVHRAAKMRTADDVRRGVDEQPEGVWSSNVKYADAVQPPVAEQEDRVPAVFPSSSVPQQAGPLRRSNSELD